MLADEGTSNFWKNASKIGDFFLFGESLMELKKKKTYLVAKDRKIKIYDISMKRCLKLLYCLSKVLGIKEFLK